MNNIFNVVTNYLRKKAAGINDEFLEPDDEDDDDGRDYEAEWQRIEAALSRYGELSRRAFNRYGPPWQLGWTLKLDPEFTVVSKSRDGQPSYLSAVSFFFGEKENDPVAEVVNNVVKTRDLLDSPDTLSRLVKSCPSVVTNFMDKYGVSAQQHEKIKEILRGGIQGVDRKDLAADYHFGWLSAPERRTAIEKHISKFKGKGNLSSAQSVKDLKVKSRPEHLTAYNKDNGAISFNTPEDFLPVKKLKRMLGLGPTVARPEDLAKSVVKFYLHGHISREQAYKYFLEIEDLVPNSDEDTLMKIQEIGEENLIFPREDDDFADY